MFRGSLRDDGVLFASIDEREVSRLRAVLEEIFGEENFVSNLVWRSRTSISDDQEVSLNHNHTLIFSKRREALEYHGEPLDESEYDNSDGDERGPWKLVPLDANKPGGNTMYPIKNPKTGVDYMPPIGRSWAINPDDYKLLFDDGRIKFGKSDDAAPKKKLYLRERLSAGETRTPSSVVLDAGTTKDGTEECAELMGQKGVFDYPKPTALISRLVQYGSAANSESTVLDFFAGSGTTGHATWIRSIADGRPRRFILVQLPEPLDKNDVNQKVAANFCRELDVPLNIAELTKERLRRSGTKLKGEHPEWKGDTGFRVYKLDQSNIRAWQPSGDLEKDLVDSVEHIIQGRNEQDVLTELLLKLGLDLCVPIEQRQIAGKAVHAVGGGVLLACLDPQIGKQDAEPLALGIVEWHQALAPAGDTTCVFRDSAFENDEAKTNLAAILDQHGIHHVRSL